MTSPIRSLASAGYDDLSFAANYYLRRRCPRLLTAAESAVDLLRRPWVEPWLLRRWGGATPGTLSVLLSLQSSPHRQYLDAAVGALGEQGSLTVLPRRSMLEGPGGRSPEVDLELVEIPRWHAPAFSRAGYFLVPRLVAMTIDLGQSLESTLRFKDVRRKVRQLLKLGYQVEVCRDEAAFLELFHRMYLPTMGKHGTRTYLRRARYLRHGLARGWVMMLSQRGRRVGGVLNIRRHGQPVIEHWAGGALDGDPGHAHRHMDSALLYYTLLWARQLPGITHLSLTSCHPFLLDGLLLFKKRWGARLSVEDIWSTCFALRINRWTGRVRRLLSLHPLVVAGRSGPVGLTAWEGPDRIAQLACAGLERTWVLCDQPEAARSSLPDGAQLERRRAGLDPARSCRDDQMVPLAPGTEVDTIGRLAVERARRE